MLRSSQAGPYVFPVAAEHSNWRDEQEAWVGKAVLLDQSNHMTDLYVKGSDTIRLLSELGINNFGNFGRDKAKQFVACNPQGYVIGDAILFGLEDRQVSLVGRPHISNWVQYNAQNGDYDVSVERDERKLDPSQRRKTYRFEVQGPAAWEVLEKLNGAPIHDMKFFSMGEITVAGRRVRALKHGMAAAPGLELWGPSEESDDVRQAIIEAGKDFGLIQAGARAYSTASTESGWFASVLPAVYNDPALADYRRWLADDSFEATGSLGGSFLSDRIEDYYIRPWDAGYNFIDFDHDFVGRDALIEHMNEPRLKKVTLIWDVDDVVRVFRSQFNEGLRYKFMDMPASYYATFPFDSVLSNGERIGFSTYAIYSSNVRRWISLAFVPQEDAEPGSRVEVIWGEADGGSHRPVVERHEQTKIRATVAPSPVPARVREGYRP